MPEFPSHWGLGLRQNTDAPKALSGNASLNYGSDGLEVSLDGAAYVPLSAAVAAQADIETGTATIAGTDDTAVVTLATIQADGAYRVTGLVLTAPVDSPTVPGAIWITDQDEEGFTINFETAPGADKSWDINWRVER